MPATFLHIQLDMYDPVWTFCDQSVNYYTGIFRHSTVVVHDQANENLGKSSALSSIHKHEMNNPRLWHCGNLN